MLLDPLFDRFVSDAPLTVMARATLEHALSPKALDELFEQTTARGYTRQLLFSTAVDLMSLVACGQLPTVKAAYHHLLGRVPVSLKSVYEKLAHIETAVSAGLVRAVAGRCRAVIDELGGAPDKLLPGYRAKILDGNHLAATHKRLKVTRGHTAGPLPGMCLVVLDADAGLVCDVVCCEDGHTHERSQIDRVLPLVGADEVWIADRNFSTTDFLQGVSVRGGCFVVRRHGNLRVRPRGAFGPEVWTERGWVRQRRVDVCREGRVVLAARHVVVRLKKPTEDGDEEVEMLTNLPAEAAGAAKVSDLYLSRWTIEVAFNELTTSLTCEPNTLGYPRAALFGFCVAVAAYNVLSVLKASLRATHGRAKVAADVSGYYMALEWSAVYPGMMVALPAERWTRFGGMPPGELAACLRAWSGKVNLRKFQKSAPRKPTQRKPPKIKDRCTHLSTAQLLRAAKQNKSRHRGKTP
jgi:IS4 transposase